MRPAVTPLSDRTYGRLEEFRRDADELIDWPLLRFLSCPLDVADAARELLDRFDYQAPDVGGDDGDTADLADPATADPEWLSWLAFLVGARLAPDATVQQQRDTIAGATTGVAAGTRASIVLAAQAALTGGRYADVRDHHGGDPWMLGITTRPTETPDPAAVLQAVRDAHVLPVGHDVAHTFYAASWSTVEADFPTWNAIEAAPTWNAIESAA